MDYLYPAVFYRLDDKIAAVFPDLENLTAIGNDLADALHRAREACGRYLFICLHDNEQPPVPAAVHEIDALAVLKENGMEAYADSAFIKIVSVDMAADTAQLGNQMVEKTFRIPMWLNTLCEVRDVDFSEVLQNALLKKIRES